MIAVIALLIVNLVFMGLHMLTLHQERKEKEKLINALIAKSAEEFRDLETTGESLGEPEAPRPQEPDLIPESELSDKQFNEAHGIE